MAGISSKALNAISENRKRFNGIEYTSELGLNGYDAFFRTLDPQVARWWQIDPKPNHFESPFLAMGDNPILNQDYLGDTSIVSHVLNNLKEGWNDFNNGKGTIYSSVDFVNRTLNPVVDVYHAVSGKDFITGDKVSRLEASVGIGLSVVGGKIEGAVIKEAEKVVAKEFTIGTFSELKSLAKGTGLDVHHVGQAASMEKMIPGYNRRNAPSILVPKEGHTVKGLNGVVNRSTNGPKTPRDLLARDIKELRRVYGVPNNTLENLIRMNKEMYFEAFQKKK